MAQEKVVFILVATGLPELWDTVLLWNTDEAM